MQGGSIGVEGREEQGGIKPCIVGNVWLCCIQLELVNQFAAPRTSGTADVSRKPKSAAHTHTHTHSVAHSHTHTSHSVARSQSHTHTRSLTHTRTHFTHFTHTPPTLHSLAHSLSHTHTLTHTSHTHNQQQQMKQTPAYPTPIQTRREGSKAHPNSRAKCCSRWLRA